jgi:hypothetical protein
MVHNHTCNLDDVETDLILVAKRALYVDRDDAPHRDGEPVLGIVHPCVVVQTPAGRLASPLTLNAQSALVSHVHSA